MLIYPAIDLLNGRCVRLRQGDYSRETVFSDDPSAIARQWVERGADRLHVVDLDGAKAGKPVNGPVIRKIVETAQSRCNLAAGCAPTPTSPLCSTGASAGPSSALARCNRRSGFAAATALAGADRSGRRCEGRIRRHRGVARSIEA